VSVLVLIGRILFSIQFLFSGFGHFAQREMMAGYAKSKGVPAAGAAVPLSGLLLLVGAVFVLVGIWPDLGALLLVIFLVPTAFLMHAFWNESEPMARMNEQTQFTKDMALAGAALIMFAVFANLGASLGLVVVGPLISLS